jgi:hypothetical protein
VFPATGHHGATDRGRVVTAGPETQLMHSGLPCWRYPSTVTVVLSPGERCPARIELSDFQVHWLRRRPCALSHVRRYHECQLEFRHDGPHGDPGQQNEQVEWWVRWTLTSSAVEQMMTCSGVCEEPDEAGEKDSCLLFEGHPGRHSFDLER